MLMRELLQLRTDIRKTLPLAKAELGMSQNDFARYARVEPSIFSRWLSGKITSEPAAQKARRALARLQRRLGVVARAQEAS